MKQLSGVFSTWQTYGNKSRGNAKKKKKQPRNYIIVRGRNQVQGYSPIKKLIFSPNVAGLNPKGMFKSNLKLEAED